MIAELMLLAYFEKGPLVLAHGLTGLKSRAFLRFRHCWQSLLLPLSLALVVPAAPSTAISVGSGCGAG